MKNLIFGDFYTIASCHFQGLLKGNPARSHLIKFNGYSYNSLRAVIDFMYNGKLSCFLVQHVITLNQPLTFCSQEGVVCFLIILQVCTKKIYLHQIFSRLQTQSLYLLAKFAKCIATTRPFVRVIISLNNCANLLQVQQCLLEIVCPSQW